MNYLPDLTPEEQSRLKIANKARDEFESFLVKWADKYKISYEGWHPIRWKMESCVDKWLDIEAKDV